MNAIITGCNRGIGLAILEKFTSMGWNVWACVRQENEMFSRTIAELSEKSDVWIKPVYLLWPEIKN